MVNKGRKNQRGPNPEGSRGIEIRRSRHVSESRTKGVELSMRNGPEGLIDTASIGQIEL